MSYLDGIKIGDRVWSFDYGWGKAIKIYSNFNKKLTIDEYFVTIQFDKHNIYLDCDDTKTYTFDGTAVDRKTANQTLFWDEIKFEVPKKPKIELEEGNFSIDIQLEGIIRYTSKLFAKNGLTRTDKNIAIKALKQIKKFTRLLALRDQECEDSRGYEYTIRKDNFIVIFDRETKEYGWEINFNWDYLGVYFKTEADAQKICDILNAGRFDLEG